MSFALHTRQLVSSVSGLTVAVNALTRGPAASRGCTGSDEVSKSMWATSGSEKSHSGAARDWKGRRRSDRRRDGQPARYEAPSYVVFVLTWSGQLKYWSQEEGD